MLYCLRPLFFQSLSLPLLGCSSMRVCGPAPRTKTTAGTGTSLFGKIRPQASLTPWYSDDSQSAVPDLHSIPTVLACLLDPLLGVCLGHKLLCYTTGDVTRQNGCWSTLCFVTASTGDCDAAHAAFNVNHGTAHF